MITDYGGLIDALKARRLELGYSQLDLDLIAGFQEMYTSKLENWRQPHGRYMGTASLTAMMAALGVGLQVVVVKADVERGKPENHSKLMAANKRKASRKSA